MAVEEKNFRSIVLSFSSIIRMFCDVWHAMKRERFCFYSGIERIFTLIVLF